MTIHERSEIPDAYGYVLANDSFLSGWGLAEGKINTVILPVNSEAEAEIVMTNARRRRDMLRVRYVMNKPRFRRGVLYSLMDREHARFWYTPEGF